MITELDYKKNHRLFKTAQRALVGGVNSPVRAFTYTGGDPIFIKSGLGSQIYDYDNKKYIDYVLSYGSLILGHAHPEVISRIQEAINLGLGFGTTHASEIELAELIQSVIPIFERLRFVTSGTEAVMSAVRLARGVTKRNKILKFEHSYHGHADYLLTKSGSGLASMKLASSSGVPADFISHTLVGPYGDINYIDSVFEKYGKDIAAILVEPVGGNYGVIYPDIDFLKYLREITRKYGTLLIFDEVITGFRFHFGSAAELLGISPDIICLGKIIGGGLPIGAYGSNKKIMKHLAPLGDVYQASTFAGNPIVMRAGIATLHTLSSIKESYKDLEEKTACLAQAIISKAKHNKIDIEICHFGSMFSVHFKIRNQFNIFYHEMLKEGIYFAPSEYESNFLSFAHKKRDIEKTINAIEKTFNFIHRRKYAHRTH